MLDTSNLSKFLKGITDALRTRKGTTDVIEHKLIDEEILNLSIVDEEDDNFNIIKAILDGHTEGTDYSYFFAYSAITDEQLATFVRQFPNRIGYRKGTKPAQLGCLFYGCKNLTVIPENTFVIKSGINGIYLFNNCDNLVAIYVPLKMYSLDYNTYIKDATEILPKRGTSNSTLKEIRIAEKGIRQSIDFSYYYGFSKESYMSIADGLIDLTGTDNAYKLTINRSYRAMENDDYEKFVSKVHNKGWTIEEKETIELQRAKEVEGGEVTQ